MTNKKLENGSILKIVELYAYISLDEQGEGIVSVRLGNVHHPMIGADKERIDSFKPYVEELGKKFGKRIVLRKFRVVEEDKNV